MRRQRVRGRAWWVRGVLIVLVAVVAACSSEPNDQQASDPVASCDTTAERVVDLLVDFVSPYRDLTPEAFLAESELDGLEEFRTEVAGLLVNENCNAEVFDSLLDDRLQALTGENLLTDFLVSTIRSNPKQRTTRNVVVEPTDDLVAVLASLDQGSTITLAAGTHDVSETLLVQVGITVQGVSRDDTTISSTAGDAAIAVFGDGALDLRDLTLRHVGPKRSSGILTFAAPVEVRNARVTGAVADEDGVGGVGLLLSASQILDADGETLGTGDGALSAIVTDTEVAGNGFAGIVLAGGLQGALDGNVVTGNGGCGICFFDGATGFARGNIIEGNQIGVQISEGAAPDIAQNTVQANEIAGVLIDGDAAPAVFDNDIAQNGEAGVDVQGAGEPLISDNRFGAQPFSLSLRGATMATAQNNTFVGGEVGLLVSEQANPSATGNQFQHLSLAGMQHEGDSTGTFADNAVLADGDGAEIPAGVGVIVRGSAAPLHTNLSVEGGTVGVFAGEQAVPQFVGAALTGQVVGLQVGDGAAPTVTDADIASSKTSGVIWADDGAGSLLNSAITDPPEIALQLGGDTVVHIRGNEVDGGGTAALVVESATPLLEDNLFSGQEFGIGVSGQARPTMRGNEITGATQVAVSFEDESGGELIANRLTDIPLVGIRATGSSEVVITNNTLAASLTPVPGDGRAVGMLFDDSATGTVSSNSVLGFAIGAQVSGTATPTLTLNTVDGASVGVAGFLYSDQASGEASENTSVNQPIGFQASANASPVWRDNTVTSAAAAAFLLQGEATPALEGNSCPELVATGIAVLERAAPELTSNDCPVVRQ